MMRKARSALLGSLASCWLVLLGTQGCGGATTPGDGAVPTPSDGAAPSDGAGSSVDLSSSSSAPDAALGTQIDTVSYSTTTAEDPPGGVDPGASGCSGCAWYSDLLYGVASPAIQCAGYDLESGQTETWSDRIVTGQHGSGSNEVGQGAGAPAHELSMSAGADVRLAPFQGVLALRVKIPATEGTHVSIMFEQGGGAGFINYDEASSSYVNDGFVLSLSRTPCDFREHQDTDVVFSDDYCTIGNSFNSPNTLTGSVQISSTSSTSRCHLKPGVYYYLNLLKTNDRNLGGTFFFTFH